MKPAQSTSRDAESAVGALRSAVREHLQRVGRGGGRELAEAAGLSPSVLSRFANGDVADVTLTTGVKLLNALRGNFAMALPGYEFVVGEDPTPTSVEVLGQVAAGSVTLEGTKRYTVDVDGHAWRTSRYWPLTHGQVVFLEVSGDSMTPMYRDGDLLACRAPVDPRNLPDRTPCVFTIRGEGSTFKLLMRARGGYLVAQPLNAAYKAIVFTAEDKPRIDWVVLGQINLGK